MSKTQDRKFMVLLYPDTEDYDIGVVLDKITGFKEYAYILHDCDIKDDGTAKKDHIHCVIRQDSPVAKSAIASRLGIDERFVEYAGKWSTVVRYLVHADDDEKFHYSPSDIVTNFDVNKYIKYKDDITMASVIFNQIVNRKCNSTIDLVKWCIDNSCWSEFRRGFAIWQCCLNEIKNQESECKK